MNKKILTLLAFCFLNCTKNFPQNHLAHVLFNDELKIQIKSFLDNVLRQADSNKILNLINTFDKNINDKEIYRLILENTPKIKPRFSLYKQIKALKHQKAIIADQIKTLIGKNVTFDNCLEIGNPGTYLSACSDFLTIKGIIYAMIEKQNLSDFVQAFKFKPTKGFVGYDIFIPLNNYEEIDEKQIPTSSLDLVLCITGLHHVPQEKLSGFIRSIRRTLKPQGIFILREHNCQTDDLKSITYTAHSLYSAITTGESVESETNEYRNFQPLEYWINIITSNGFIAGNERLVQKGDPTLNTLLKFTKKAISEEEIIAEISQNLKQSDKDYNRDLSNSYLTSTEWYNVDISQEYANFINHTPFYEFPYFKSIKTYWQIFFNSWKSAAKNDSHINILLSEHTLMNLFIGITMSIEYGIKGLISAPMRLLFSGEESKVIKAIIYDPKNEILKVSDNIKIINSDINSNIKTIEIPRYKEFLKILIKISETDINIKEIAGQKQIQFKVKTVNKSPEFDCIDGCHKEYSWKSVSQPENIITVLTVEIPKINNVIRKLYDENVEILYIHDF